MPDKNNQPVIEEVKNVTVTIAEGHDNNHLSLRLIEKDKPVGYDINLPLTDIIPMVSSLLIHIQKRAGGLSESEITSIREHALDSQFLRCPEVKKVRSIEDDFGLAIELGFAPLIFHFGDDFRAAMQKSRTN